VDFGYEDAVTLIVPVRAESSLAAQPSVRLGAEIRVLVCREMCIPGKTQLSLTLPIKSLPPAPDLRTRELFAAARKELPQPAPQNWKFSVDETGDSFVLAANVTPQIAQATFFPLAEAQIDNSAPQTLRPLAGGFRLILRKSDRLLKPIERLRGVLVLSGNHAYLIDAPVSKRGAEEQLLQRNPRNTIFQGGNTEMKRFTLYPMLVTLVICIAPLLVAAAKVGQAAPDFTATASNGKTFRISDYRGKYVAVSYTHLTLPTICSV